MPRLRAGYNHSINFSTSSRALLPDNNPLMSQSPPKSQDSSKHLWLLPATVLLSAWLLFQVQPMVAKRILPWFGGGSAVWTTSMLFFQIALLAGYAYAHATTAWLTPRRQVFLHGLLLAGAVVVLILAPIVP